MNRAFTNLLCADIDAHAHFFQAVLGMTQHFTSDWFIILTHPGIPGLEFGLLSRSHDTVPASHRVAPAGVILTFVVADVAACHARAVEIGAKIVEPPRVMPYGQRRLLVAAPEGTLVDISAPT
ncbi:MAG: VOC family protein [Pseudomonadota bacterium]